MGFVLDGWIENTTEIGMILKLGGQMVLSEFSWVQLERAVEKNEKLKSFKLESFCWKEPSEVGKNRAKLERTQRS